MGEYFHAYRNADHLVAGFQSILLRNWPYLERSDNRAQLFELLSELVLGLLGSSLNSEQFSLMLRGTLGWCKETLDGRYASEYDEPLRRMGEALTELQPAYATAFLERDALLRNLVERAGARPALAHVYAGLYRRVLAGGYRRVARSSRRTDLGAHADGRSHRPGRRRPVVRLPLGDEDAAGSSRRPNRPPTTSCSLRRCRPSRTCSARR